MSYLPGFEHDIFISYSWIDNETSSPDEKGWVEQFDKELQIRLKKLVSKRIVVWRDNRIKGNNPFNEVLEKAIKSTAVFVSLTTPNCLHDSPYCELERKAFFEKAQKEDFGLSVNSRFRVVNVLLYNIPYTEWPAEYGKDQDATSGFPFYQLDEDAEPDDLGKPFDPGSDKFNKKLDRLVVPLRSLLIDMNLEKITAPEPLPDSDDDPETGGFTIFIADTSETLSKTKKNILTQLAEHDMRVLPKAPPPYEPAQHEKAVRQQLEKADLSVHLLGDSPGREIDDVPEEYYLIKQADLALKHAKSQLIWMPQTVKIEEIDDEGYRNLLKQLQTDRPQEKDIELCKGLPTEIMQAILDKKAKIELQHQQASQTTATGVLMDYHVQDEATFYELAGLLKKNGVKPDFVAGTEHEPEEKRKYYESLLGDIAVLVILFGHVGVDWVVERIRTVQRMVAINNYGLHYCSIYLASQKSAAEMNAIMHFIQQQGLKLQQMSLELAGDPEELISLVQKNRGAS